LKKFSNPMTKTEAIVGWLYLFIHIFALQYLIALIDAYLLPLINVELSTANLNVLYYCISFIFVLCFLFKYMRTNFSYFTGSFLDTLKTVVWGYVLYNAAMFVIQMLLSLVLEKLANPNTSDINELVKLNPNSMIVVAVLMAPIVEEMLFRGVVFGTIRRKNRILAYVVSALLFSVYHLWRYMLDGLSWDLLLYLVQYIPPSIVLAWCYEKSRNVWAPVFLHMMINFVSVQVTLAL